MNDSLRRLHEEMQPDVQQPDEMKGIVEKLRSSTAVFAHDAVMYFRGEVQFRALIAAHSMAEFCDAVENPDEDEDNEPG